MKFPLPPHRAGLDGPDAQRQDRLQGAGRASAGRPAARSSALGASLELPLAPAPAAIPPAPVAMSSAPAANPLPAAAVSAPARRVYSVSRLNREVRQLLETGV